ncbi:MAG: FtsX-like permease family protein, partial [Terriglobales bacterium]
MPIGTAATLEVHASHFLGGQRAIAELSGGFAILALLLAGLGLYGVMAFAVARRTNEIGVRMALGARPAWVLRMVLGDAARVVAPGLVVGAALAVPAVGLLRSQMFGLSPLDPTALAGAVVALLAVALAAAFWPAQRAAHIEPWLALHRD